MKITPAALYVAERKKMCITRWPLPGKDCWYMLRDPSKKALVTWIHPNSHAAPPRQPACLWPQKPGLSGAGKSAARQPKNLYNTALPYFSR